MDPISLILGALAAGALRGADQTADAAVADAYNGLKNLVRRRLKGKKGADLMLEGHEKDPESWELPLEKALVEADAETDSALIEKAKELSELLDPQGKAVGKYSVVVDRSNGVQVGDHNKLKIRFN